jgi:hypothetical protein
LNVTIVTFVNGEQCTPQVNTSQCLVLETDTRLLVSGDVDAEVSAFLAYKMLQEEMAGNTFLETLSVIDHIEYLRPVSALPPPIVDDNQNNRIGADNRSISANPWTLGAVLAMCKFFSLYMLFDCWSWPVVSHDRIIFFMKSCAEYTTGTGGLIAIYAWVRNRRTRNRRHMQLIEEM